MHDVEPDAGRFRVIEATRVVAAPAALDAGRWAPEALVLRIAPDEALVVGGVDRAAVDDPHAIVERDTGFVAAWLPGAEAADLLERTCAWPRPAARPAFAQGLVAGLPAKLWLEADRVLFVVPAPFAVEAEARLR